MKTIFCSLLSFFILIVSVIAVDAAGDWIQKFPSTKPSARWGHAMAYIGDDKALLFGGYDGYTLYDETWVYDFSDNTWTLKTPLSKPPAQYEHAMAYIGDDKVLLYSSKQNDYETWVYDLSDNTWTQKKPLSYPKSKYHEMVYIGDDKVFLASGEEYAGGCYAWVYDLSDNTWTDKKSDLGDPIVDYKMAYIGDDKVLLFGGYDGCAMYDGTWVYDFSDNTWTRKSPSLKPSPRWGHAMAYIGEDKVLLFDYETWVYDLSDNTWRQNVHIEQPSGRAKHVLSETSMDGSNYIVLFGGAGGAIYDDTWTFGRSISNPEPAAPAILAAPKSFKLLQNFSNPFNPDTWIPYHLAEGADVMIRIYNTTGQLVRTLELGHKKAGFYTSRDKAAYWDGKDNLGEKVASGVYFYALQAGKFRAIRKMVILK